MRNCKRLTALLMACAMLLSFAAAAGAEEGSYYNTEGYPICNEVIDVTMAGPLPSGLEDWTKVVLIENFKNDLGINITCQFYNSEDWSTQLTLMIASDELTDMVGGAGMNMLDANEWGAEGYLLNFNDYRDMTPNMNKYMEQYPEAEAYMTAPDGGIYAIPKLSLDETDRFSRTFINKKWLERVNMETPKTMDELYEVLKAFKEQDANGNGDPDDEIPFLYANGYTASERVLLSAYGIHTSDVNYILQTDGNGKVYLANTTDAYKEYMKWMARAYGEGLIEQEAFVIDANTVFDRGSKDLYGFYGCGSAPYVVAKQDISYDAENFEAIAALTSEYNETPTAGKASPIGETGLVAISATSPYKEALVRMMDYMYTDEGELAGVYGAEGETFDWEHNDILNVDVPKMRILEGCTSGEETRYKYGTLNNTLNVIEWNNDRRALFTAPIEDVQSDEILNEYGWAALVALAVREDGIQQVDCFPKLSYTAEEASERATLKTDLENYLKQAKAQFMTGEIDVEEGWDNFVNTVNGMGLERLIEIEQAAYDRYLTVAQAQA